MTGRDIFAGSYRMIHSQQGVSVVQIHLAVGLHSHAFGGSYFFGQLSSGLLTCSFEGHHLCSVLGNEVW